MNLILQIVRLSPSDRNQLSIEGSEVVFISFFVYFFSSVFDILRKMFDHGQNNKLIAILLKTDNVCLRYKSTRHAPKRPCIRERASGQRGSAIMRARAHTPQGIRTQEGKRHDSHAIRRAV